MNAATKIKSPGKFEGCCEYVPYLWEISLEQGCCRDVWGGYRVDILPEDVAKYPELGGHRFITLREDSNGFVYGTLD
jgi:hypothetical protein